jgi:hypothetical protein
MTTDRKPIATLNSVKAGVLHCTVRTDARSLPLEGQLCAIETAGQTILGRIARVDLVNPIHEDPVFAPLIMDRGKVTHFSGECADIETCLVEVVSCVNKASGKLEARSGNPRSGTDIMPALDIAPFWREKERYAVVGIMPGEWGGQATVINRHYGAKGGWGEAKHLGIFGQTGSGKTVIYLTLLACRLVANRSMGALLLDTKGDLATDGYFDNEETGFGFSFHDLLQGGGRGFESITADEIAIQRVDAFEDILTDWLVSNCRLGKRENIEAMVGRAVPEALLTADGRPRKKIDDAGEIDYGAVMAALGRHAARAWSGNTATQKANDLQDYANSPSIREEFNRHVLRYFSGGRKIWGILRSVLQDGRVIILKLGSARPAQQERVLYELLSQITIVAEEASKKRADTSLNAIVGIDEAHRWVPQGGKDRICQTVLDAIRTTRSYHIGWWLISQSMAGIENEAMRQMSTKWFGRGLDTGADIKHLENYLGESGKLVYDTLNYQGGYFSIGVGQEVNLGTGNSYQAVLGFPGDATQSLRRANPHIWRP